MREWERDEIKGGERGRAEGRIIIMYIYHALINALGAHMIHINLNDIKCQRGGRGEGETEGQKGRWRKWWEEKGKYEI